MRQLATSLAVAICVGAFLLVGGAMAGRAPAGLGAPGPIGSPVTGVKVTTAQRRASFLSLSPACGCQDTTLLERFALTNGRPLGALARLPGGSGVQLSGPHAVNDGSVWLTVSRGPRYRSGVAGGDPAPDSCSGQIVRFAPTTGRPAAVLTVPHSTLLGAAVPSPNGRSVAMVVGGCATSFFNEHLTVENLRTGRRFTLGTDAAPCHALFDVAWNPSGTQLVFPYGPSTLTPHSRYVPNGTCTEPRFSRLVVVSAQHTTSLHAWRLLGPDAGCSYQAASFARWGLAAIEECTRGRLAGHQTAPALGNAYLLALTAHGRQIARVPLAPGYDAGDIAANPVTGTVLVSEYQAANQGFPVYNWVWAYNGHTLRVIHRYRNQDSATVIAEPW
jgi:hypothetical protein